MDDVPDATKHERMVKMVELYRSQVEKLNKKLEGTQQLVLIEGVSFPEAVLGQGCPNHCPRRQFQVPFELF